MLAALCPDVCVVPVRIAQVVDGQSIARVPKSVLSQGIEWCIDNHIRLVNISYSIEEIHYDGPLATVCRKAAKHNFILVAAYRNNITKPVYPAAFASVIGVSIRKNLDHAQISVVSGINHFCISNTSQHSKNTKRRLTFFNAGFSGVIIAVINIYWR
jgi:hypothetical protein